MEDKTLYWIETYRYTENFFNSHPEIKVGAEIGIAGGEHILHLLQHTQLEKIYGIDPLVSETWNVPTSIEDFDEHYKLVCEKLKPFDKKSEIIRKTSVEGAKEIEDESLDFVFIDAIHEYKECLEDITVWYPKVKNGGYVMGHDWDHCCFPGVQDAVRKYFEGKEIVGVGSPVHVWYVEKNEIKS